MQPAEQTLQQREDLQQEASADLRAARVHSHINSVIL